MGEPSGGYEPLLLKDFTDILYASPPSVIKFLNVRWESGAE
jgi:hypothetical protein